MSDLAKIKASGSMTVQEKEAINDNFVQLYNAITNVVT